MARTVEEIPGGARVTDFISLGVLSEKIPRAEVRRVLEETGRQSERRRKLPMDVMVYYVVALALYMEVSYGEVLRCLLEGLDWVGLPVKPIRTVRKSSISRARMRLGVEPVERLYRELVGPVAVSDTRGAFYRGRRLVSLDGTGVDVADVPKNEDAFGRPGSPRGKSAFPQIRFVTLAECGTHVLFGARMGPCDRAESELARPVLAEGLTDGMLCLADRYFFGYPLFRQAASTGADLLWRLKKNHVFPCQKRLPDGSYLSKTYPSPRDRAKDRNGRPVRVIEYRLEGTGGDAEPLYRLVTTLLDPEQAPAEELAALYHQRWEVENAFDELKVHLRGPGVVLRSRTPELVRQEFYGFLLAHYAVRDLMHEAALEADLDPDTVSFTHTVRVVRRKLPRYGAFPPSGKNQTP